MSLFGWLKPAHPVLLKYLRREVYKSVSFVMLAFVGLFAFFDMLAEVDRLSRPGASWTLYLLSVFFGLPSRVYEIAPIAALIGSIYALVQLAASSEFTAMRAAGMTTGHIVAMMSRIAVGVVLLTLVFGEVVAPVAETVAVPTRAKALVTDVNRDFRSGYWLRDAKRDAEGHLKVRFVNFKDFSRSGQLKDIEYFQFDEEAHITEWIRASTGSFDPVKGHWILENVTRQSYAPSPNPESPADSWDQPQVQIRPVERISQVTWESTLTPELLTGLFVQLDRMSAIQLYRYSRFLASNLQSTGDVDLAFAKKVVYPFAIFIMMLISLSFAYLHFRSGGVSVRVFMGIMIGVGFYLVNNLFSHLSGVANLPPFLSASLPTLVGLVVGLASLWWVSRPAPLHRLRGERKVPDIGLMK